MHRGRSAGRFRGAGAEAASGEDPGRCCTTASGSRSGSDRYASLAWPAPLGHEVNRHEGLSCGLGGMIVMITGSAAVRPTLRGEAPDPVDALWRKTALIFSRITGSVAGSTGGGQPFLAQRESSPGVPDRAFLSLRVGWIYCLSDRRARFAGAPVRTETECRSAAEPRRLSNREDPPRWKRTFPFNPAWNHSGIRSLHGGRTRSS